MVAAERLPAVVVGAPEVRLPSPGPCPTAYNRLRTRGVLLLLELLFVREAVFNCSVLSSYDINYLIDFICISLKRDVKLQLTNHMHFLMRIK